VLRHFIITDGKLGQVVDKNAHIDVQIGALGGDDRILRAFAIDCRDRPIYCRGTHGHHAVARTRTLNVKHIHVRTLVFSERELTMK